MSTLFAYYVISMMFKSDIYFYSEIWKRSFCINLTDKILSDLSPFFYDFPIYMNPLNWCNSVEIILCVFYRYLTPSTSLSRFMLTVTRWIWMNLKTQWVSFLPYTGARFFLLWTLATVVQNQWLVSIFQQDVTSCLLCLA